MFGTARKIVDQTIREIREEDEMTRARTDNSQASIVKAVRKAGGFVQSLAEIGRGCPDILVGYRGKWEVWELKDGTQPPSKRKLTPDEYDWHQIALHRVNISVPIIESEEQALDRLMGF